VSKLTLSDVIAISESIRPSKVNVPEVDDEDITTHRYAKIAAIDAVVAKSELEDLVKIGKLTSFEGRASVGGSLCICYRIVNDSLSTREDRAIAMLEMANEMHEEDASWLHESDITVSRYCQEVGCSRSVAENYLKKMSDDGYLQIVKVRSRQENRGARAYRPTKKMLDAQKKGKKK
jgi:hypothetical protein